MRRRNKKNLAFMYKPGCFENFMLSIAVLLISVPLNAQVDIRGTIYDRSLRIALQGVTVMSSSGKNALTDNRGNYRISLAPDDSIYFSYLNKRTLPFAVRSLEYPQQFDMSLDIATDSLPPVTVWSRNYYQDSLENRKEYEKVFNYGGPELTSNVSSGQQASTGFNLDLFFNMAKGRRMESFQKRLVADEQDRYVNHHFTKTLVRKITGLESPALDSFMRVYRPGYSFLLACETEYDYYKYILDCSRWFREDWMVSHPELFKSAAADSALPVPRVN